LSLYISKFFSKTCDAIYALYEHYAIIRKFSLDMNQLFYSHSIISNNCNYLRDSFNLIEVSVTDNPPRPEHFTQTGISSPTRITV